MYPHKHRKPNRLRGYDYRKDALYFVTVCVEGRICSLGEIADGEMCLNEFGKIAERQWHWLAEQYPYVMLHDFVVMPNHIHGIIEINRENISERENGAASGDDVGTGRDLSFEIPMTQIEKGCGPPIEIPGTHKETGRDLSIETPLTQKGTGRDLSLQPPKIKSLSGLMGAYKTTTSKQIRRTGMPEFTWQRSFHDHIIRNESGYLKIAEYILNNPVNWEQDSINPNSV